MQRLLARELQVCPVCQFGAQSITQHIDHLFFERVTDVATRAAIRKSQGFCRLHARLVSRQADALGTALIIQDILINELRALEAGDFGRPRAPSGVFSRFFDGSDSLSRKPHDCPLCDVERETESLTVDSLLDALRDTEFAAIFRRSAGLCLPHFHLAFERRRDVDAWNIALDTQKRALGELAAELGELARKSDYRFSSEEIGPESDSWRRGLGMTSGWTED